MLALLWSALMFFIAFSFWKHARAHAAESSLGMSTVSSLRDASWSRLLRKMTGTVTILCAASAFVVFFMHAWFLGILLVLAIPVAGALTFVRGKSALSDSYRRSLPPS